jgi:hypothetical protein
MEFAFLVLPTVQNVRVPVLNVQVVIQTWFLILSLNSALNNSYVMVLNIGVTLHINALTAQYKVV